MDLNTENHLHIYTNNDVMPAGDACSAPVSPGNGYSSCALEYLLLERQVMGKTDVSALQISPVGDPVLPSNYETTYTAEKEHLFPPDENSYYHEGDSFNCTNALLESVVKNNFTTLANLPDSNNYQLNINNLINYANEIKSLDFTLSGDDVKSDTWNEAMDIEADPQITRPNQETTVHEFSGNLPINGSNDIKSMQKNIVSCSQNVEGKDESDTHGVAGGTVENAVLKYADVTQNESKFVTSDMDNASGGENGEFVSFYSQNGEIESDLDNHHRAEEAPNWMSTEAMNKSADSAENLNESGHTPMSSTLCKDSTKITANERTSSFKIGNKSSSLFFESSLFGSGIILGSNEKIRHDTVQRYDLLRPLGTFRKPWEASSGEKKSGYLKNLIVMSLGYMFLFTATGSVNNLQTSLNHEGGVGLFSMATSFIGWTLFSMFSPLIVLRFHPKLCMVIGFIIQTLYILSNLYPEPYLLIPMSGMSGMTLAILWNAMSTYVMTLSKYQASEEGILSEHVSGKFYGIFFLFFQFAFVFGNIVTSIVLLYIKPQNSSQQTEANTMTDTTNFAFNDTGPLAIVITGVNSTNTTDSDNSAFPYHLCGSKYWHSFKIDHAAMNVTQQTKYVLFGVYFACSLVAILIVGIFMKSFTPFNARSVTCRHTLEQLKRTCKLLINKWFLAVLPINIFASLQHGFAISELTKAFITCPLGLGMVGYLMAFLAFCSSVSSFSSGCIGKYVGRVAIIFSASLVNLGCLLVMFLWQPVPFPLYPFFILFGAWGFAHGIWSSVISTLMGILFEDRVEESYACHRFIQGITLAVSYFYAQHLGMEVKMYIMVGMCILGLITYWITEHFLKKWKIRQFELKIEA